MSDDRESLLQKHARKIQNLRNVNSGLADEIESMGQNVDLSVPRLEHFISWLVEEKIITIEQQLEEQEKWERHLRPQLISIRDRIKDALQKMQAAQQRKQKTQEPTQQSIPSLVLPASVKQSYKGDATVDGEAQSGT